MPSSSVRTFTDPDDYAGSFRATKAELTITRRGRFAAKLTRLDLHHLCLGRFSENLPRIAHLSVLPGRANISFRMLPGASLVTGGLELRQSQILRRGGAPDYFQQSTGPVCFGSISLPVDDLTSLGAALAGCDLTPPKDAAIVTPSPAALAKLLCLHSVAGQLAEDAPAVLAHPECARGLEQALIEAMVGCLNTGEVVEDRSAQGHHAMIVRRFSREIEEHCAEPIYIPELCKTIGVSERTLRICCQEQLGMSPKRYLLLRRMHLARRALRESSPTETTVTEIATRYGFFQLGRFAGEYRSIFGELPSTILARAAE